MQHHSQHWTSAARSHVGRVRELNEDACLALPEQGLWVVADGMGGHAAGDLASRMVVESLREIGPAADLGELTEQTRRILQQVNRRLTQEASRRRQQIIGSTVAALLIRENRCHCLWAGDSRVYLLRGDRLQRLTRDHSQAEELIAKGLIRRSEADRLPGANAITRAVGVMQRLELDTLAHDVHEKDTFLLCSDGLYNELSEQEIASILLSGDCRSAADALIERVLQGKARDNISVILVRIESDQITKTLFNPAAARSEPTQEDDDKTTLNH